MCSPVKSVLLLVRVMARPEPNLQKYLALFARFANFCIGMALQWRDIWRSRGLLNSMLGDFSARAGTSPLGVQTPYRVNGSIMQHQGLIRDVGAPRGLAKAVNNHNLGVVRALTICLL